MKIVAVSAGAANPSSTRQLTDRVLTAVEERLPEAEIQVIDVREFGQDLRTATTSGLRSDRLTAALEAVAGEQVESGRVRLRPSDDFTLTSSFEELLADVGRAEAD